jgi:hypothetical protein
MGASDPVTHNALAGSKRGQTIDNAERPQGTADSPDPVRRVLLTSLLAASAASVIPPAFAVPTGDAAQDAFLSASQILTGQSSLDPGQASLLYSALIADDAQFAGGVQALAKILGQPNIDLLQLQRVLDNENSPVAALPRKIATAWYTGIVGEGEKARCVTYETALMNVVVADELQPPSYCYGAPGSWVKKPG